MRRRLLPRPRGAIVYELTDRGRALEPAVLALGRRAAPLLGEPGADEIVTADPQVTAIRTTSTPRPRAASTSAMRCESARSWSTRIDDGSLAGAAGPLPGADLALETDRALRPLLAGELAPADAIAGGAIRIHGDPALLTTFAAVFQIEHASPGATLEG